MLDVDFGSYPFVTSSNTICAGACTGLGLGPNKIGEVYGIMKAYCTRVGSGPFPTELFDETGKTIRDLGHEYGAVTGRERRCGWVDLVALRYAIMVNGVTQLILMKSDVLDGFDTVKACVAYKVNGEEIDYFPYDITEGVEPVYVELPGWKTDMTKMTSEDEFPEEFNAYIAFLEEQLETPIKIVSVLNVIPKQNNRPYYIREKRYRRRLETGGFRPAFLLLAILFLPLPTFCSASIYV